MISILLLISVFCFRSASASTAKGFIGDRFSSLCPKSLKRRSSARISRTHALHSSDPLRATDDLEGIKDTQLYDFQIKKAKKKHIKEISRLCVETFIGDGDDWLHANREKQRVARDLTSRWSKLLV